MRILFAEADPMIGASVRRGLTQDGFTVDWVRDGRAAELALAERVHDALLLDLGLARKTGLDVLTAMRRAGHARPVLILTARDAIGDRVAGLDAGADDYLVKPFALDELLARLRALLRRTEADATGVLEYAHVRLDPTTREVTCRERGLDLTRTEFALLELLLRNPRVVLPRSQAGPNGNNLFVRPPPLGGAGGLVQTVDDRGQIRTGPDTTEIPLIDGTIEVAAGTKEPFFADVDVDGTPLRVYTTRFNRNM